MFAFIPCRILYAIQEYKSEDTRNYNFACILYGCENWSLTLREERRLRLFENRVLNTIFGPARDEVTRVWRILHYEELNPLNPELNPICYLLALLGAHHFLHLAG